MAALVFITLLAIPVADLVLLIPIGSRIGLEVALAVTVVAAILGIVVIRLTGFSVIRSLQQAMRENRLPICEVIDGAMVVGAGVLLVWPGLVSDVVAAGLLLPPLRRSLVRTLMAMPSQRPMPRWSSVDGRSASADGAGPVIDGEYRNLDDRPPQPTQAPPRLPLSDEPTPPAGPPRR